MGHQQRMLGDWGLFAPAGKTDVTLRVFSKGALQGVFVVSVLDTPTLIKDLVWAPAWSDAFDGAEVVSVDGDVYAAPMEDVSELDEQTGTLLSANFDIGIVPLGERSNPPPEIV